MSAAASLFDALVILPLLRSLQRLSSPTAVRLGAALGVLAWRLGVRRRLVNRTMELTLGLRGPARARLARQAYATIGANFIEIWTAGGVDGIERHVTPANPQWARLMQQRHPGLILATLHLGSWDGSLIGGRPCFTSALAYAKAQHHPASDALLNERRQVSGAKILLTRQGDRSGAVTVVRMLRQGGGVVGLLGDQRPRRDEAVAATFLGQSAWCHPGAAFFASKTGAWVAPAFALRISAKETRLYVLRPFPIHELGDVATQRVMDALSSLIAAFPGQYFWHHRRFTDAPASCPSADSRWRSGLGFFRHVHRHPPQ